MVLQFLTKIILNGQLVRIVALLVGGPRRRIRRLAISVQGQVSVDGQESRRTNQKYSISFLLKEHHRASAQKSSTTTKTTRIVFMKRT